MQAICPNGSIPEPSRRTPGPIRISAPPKPMMTPRLRRRVRRSSVNRCASGSTKSGSAAIEMPAKAEGTYCWPQLSRLKGTAVLKVPISSRCGRVCRSGSGRRSTTISPTSATAPSVVRAQATVSGP